MIKVNKGFIQVTGEKSDILAEVSVLIYSLRNAITQEEGVSDDEAKADIMKAVDAAFNRKKPSEDMDAEKVEELAEKAADKLGELIHRVVDELIKGKDEK